MITLMREYLKVLHVFLWLVIAAFIGSLFYLGTTQVGDGAGDSVAVVNGEKIPGDRYRRRYQAYMDNLARVSRDQFTPAMAERLGLPERVLDDLVQEELVMQRARAEGLAVTDEELNAQIQAIRAFHENGRFSLRRYQEFQRRRAITAAAFESDVRRELTRLKVENLVKNGVRVTDSEVEQAFAYRNERVRAAWALVETAPIAAKMTAADPEVEAYLSQHAAEFRLPDRRRVQYVVIGTKGFVEPVPDGDIEAYYKEHAAEFESPRQARAAHVLVRVPETGGSEAETRARAKVQDVIRRARAGEDFAKLAREVSEDPGSAGTGGELGWVSRGETVPQFEEAVFALPKGGISSEPVRTPFGYHAVTVLDTREGGRKPLKEVAPQIRDQLLAERSTAAAGAKADEVRPPLGTAKDFQPEAKRLGLEPHEVVMSRSAALPGVGPNDAVQEAAFTLAVGGVSSPLKTPAGFVILKVLEHLPSAVPPLAEIKERVADAVRAKKADGIAVERARKLTLAAKDGDLVALARKEGLSAGATGSFSRAKPPSDRLPGEAMLAALTTPVGAISDPVRTEQWYYVVKTLERVPPDPGDLAKEREPIAREEVEAKRGQAWESWLGAARAKAKIERTGPGPPRS